MPLPWLTIGPLLVFATTVMAIGAVRAVLNRRAILDHPNERSSHAVPTPRGGGLAVVPVLMVGWAAAWSVDGFAAPHLWPLLGGAIGLAAISWVDDLRSLPPAWRLAAQAVAVALGFLALPGDWAVFQGLLPHWLDGLATALLWLWFVNLFNFMDGIDGITGTETVFVAAGAGIVALIAEGSPFVTYAGLTAAAAALGFLVWNRPPARIFLGDVGSVPLGYLMGWLLLHLAATGQWAAALILPLYYLADSTITLGRRLARGEKVWQAHRQHFYQRAVQRGRSHGDTVVAIAAGNLVLCALAWGAAMAPAWHWAMIAGALATVAALLWWLARDKKPIVLAPRRP